MNSYDSNEMIAFLIFLEGEVNGIDARAWRY